MRKRNKNDNLEMKRLLGIDDLCEYMGLGRCTAAEFGKRNGAVVRIGRRVLYDRSIIDRAIESERLQQGANNVY